MYGTLAILMQTPIDAPERALVLAARAGEHAAQEALVKSHRQAAYLLALQLLGNREDALDVAQDALLRLLTKLDGFDEERPVRPWLLRVVHNRAQDLRRQQRVRRAEALEPADGEAGPVLVDPGIDPETQSSRNQLRRRIWRALRELPAPQRDILVLRDYQDLSYAEIADFLNIPLGTVMSRLHGARKRLRVLLEADGVGEAGPGGQP